MVLYLWSPAGLVECRALRLKRAHPMRPVVPPSRCEEPGFGDGGEMLLAKQHLTLEKTDHSIFSSGMQKEYTERRFHSPRDPILKTLM